MNEPMSADDAQQPSDESVRSGKEGVSQALNRLKQQRNEARQEAASLKNELGELRRQFESFTAEFRSQKNGNGGSADDLTPTDLLRYATNQEYVAQNPHLAIHAAIKYNEKLLRQERDKMRQDILNEVFGTIQKQKDDETVYSEITRDFGNEALDPDSDIFILADKKYRALQQKYGAKEIDSKPHFKKMVFQEAHRELGMDRVNDKPLPSEPKIRPKSPPPETMPEGTGEGGVDAMALSKSALDKGDWQTSLGLKVKSLYQ